MPIVTLEPRQSLDVGPNEAVPLFYTHYDQRQGQHGPTLVLLHGAGLHHLSWPPQLRRFPGTVVYALDLPGHGASGAAQGAMSIGDYAAVVQRFIIQLALEEVVLVGHSMGAAIALTCALRMPATSLSALVLIGAGATLPVNRRIFEGLTQNFVGMTAKLVDWMYGPDWPSHYRQRAIDDLRKNSITQLVADFEACNAFNVREQLQRVHLPTLILCGELDKMTPVSFSEELATTIPQSELTLVPQIGHMAMLEAADFVRDRIQTFLNTPLLRSKNHA